MKAAGGVVFDHVVTTEVSQVRANRGGLAGDRRTREATRVEVTEIATEHATIEEPSLHRWPLERVR